VFRRQPRTFNGGAANISGQLDRWHIFERAAKAADGGADGADNKNVGWVHAGSPGFDCVSVFLLGASLESATLLAYAETAQGRWCFLPFQLK
jgi:hypothetical protein